MGQARVVVKGSACSSPLVQWPMGGDCNGGQSVVECGTCLHPLLPLELLVAGISFSCQIKPVPQCMGLTVPYISFFQVLAGLRTWFTSDAITQCGQIVTIVQSL